MSEIWYLDGKPVDYFPGASWVMSVWHIMAQVFELGHAVYCWDPSNADDVAARLRLQLEGAR